MAKASADGQLLHAASGSEMSGVGASGEGSWSKNAIFGVEASAKAAGRHALAESTTKAASTEQAATKCSWSTGGASCTTRGTIVAVREAKTWSFLGSGET